MTDHSNSGLSSSSLLRALLTEPFLWAALVLLAAVLRLTDLGAAPLDAVEAQQALAAYRAVQAGSGPGVAQPAPLLFHLNALLFILFKGGDGLARLVPALAGVGLVLTPLLLRDYLGRWGALGMGLLLALSPTSLLVSRRLDGALPAALGIMLLVGYTARFLDTWNARYAVFAGLGLAMALTAGPGAWGLLAGLFLALGGALWLWRSEVAWIGSLVRPAVKRGLAAAGLGVLALSTGLGFNPAGLAAAGEQFLAWLGRFSVPTGVSFPHVLVLGSYEPLILVAGLVGLIRALRRRHAMGLVLAFWAAVGEIQLALMPGRELGDLLWVLLPMSGLAGLAVEELVRSLRERGRWLNEGLYLPVSLVLWVHFGLTLAAYSRSGRPTDLTLALLSLLLQVFLTAAFGFAISAPEPGEVPAEAMARGLEAALRGGALSLGLVLLTITLSLGWRLSHRWPTDPRRLPSQETVAIEVHTLVDVVDTIGVANVGSRGRLPIAFLDEADPTLAWALRQFDQEILDEDPLPDPQGVTDNPPLILAPTRFEPPPGYLAEAFPLRRTWPPSWSRQEAVRWWMYGESNTPAVITERIVLWMRKDLALSIDDES